ncbi:YihY/virulence factor BrkB family protein [Amnibacterium endophyticum]|uniref:YihY/virulence factor BrkB family protein n=1 Tax=Amnibacterium endophyticum TaxID=2109337 RepID=A0ABW4LI69_9MICO
MRGSSRTTGAEVATAARLTAAIAGAVGIAAAAGRIVDRRQERREARRDPGQSRTDLDSRATLRLAESAPPPDWAGKPRSPTDLHGPTLRFALRQSVLAFRADRCSDLAGSLVYHAVLAVGPAVLVVLAIFGFFSPDAVDALVQRLQPVQATAPSTYDVVTSVIRAASQTPAPGVGLALGIAGALWSASGYVRSMGRALNRVYEVAEGRPVWRRWPEQIALTIAIVLLAAAGALLLASGGDVVTRIASALGLAGPAFVVFQVVRWPLLVLIAATALALLYSFASNVRQPGFRWTSPGAVLALIAWALATAGFALYLSVAGGFGSTYGPVAGVVVFVLWLYLTNLALLLGAELDAELERARELQAGMRAEHRIQLPPRDADDVTSRTERRDATIRSAVRLRETRGRVG